MDGRKRCKECDNYIGFCRCKGKELDHNFTIPFNLGKTMGILSNQETKDYFNKKGYGEKRYKAFLALSDLCNAFYEKEER